MTFPIIGPRSPIVLLVPRCAVMVSEQSTLSFVALAMTRANVTAALVGCPVTGIITDRDLALGLASGLGPDDAIETLFTRQMLTVSPTTSVVDAAALMLNNEIGHLVIEIDENNRAILSLREVMAALLQAVEPRIWLTSLRIAVTKNQSLLAR